MLRIAGLTCRARLSICTLLSCRDDNDDDIVFKSVLQCRIAAYKVSLFGEDGIGSSQTTTKERSMATVTQIQEATNAEGQPIKLAVAYDDKVHNEVRTLSTTLC